MRNKLTKATLTMSVALAAVAALALPASAHGGHVAVFQGEANITNGTLGFPNNPAVTADWDFAAFSGPNVCASTAPCDISADGHLAASATVAGEKLGAWCGLSRGWGGEDVTGSGANFARAAGGGDSHTIDSVGWITSAGSLLVIDGHYTADDGSGDNGLVVGFVQASGSNLFADCVAGTTATFTVTGVAALLVN